jgi:hypothetical protein
VKHTLFVNGFRTISPEISKTKTPKGRVEGEAGESPPRAPLSYSSKVGQFYFGERQWVEIRPR